MQTILGANGQIAEELTKALYKDFTKDIRLVSRTPKKIHETDALWSANLMDAEATEEAVKGTSIAYLTVGLPMDSKLWEDQFLVMMTNVINACKTHDTKLVFFDNTYMYAKTSTPQTEGSPFAPSGRKSTVRAKMAELLLNAMSNNSIEAVICRAPEFYGPNKTQSITNTLIFDNIKKHKTLKVPLSDTTKRSLIWTPDASKAMALIGNTPDAYNQTWHLPCDDDRLTYRELIDLSSKAYDKKLNYRVLKLWKFKIGGLFNTQIRELQELLPRYTEDNIFVSDKFKTRFPDFKITSYKQGVETLISSL